MENLIGRAWSSMNLSLLAAWPKKGSLDPRPFEIATCCSMRASQFQPNRHSDRGIGALARKQRSSRKIRNPRYASRATMAKVMSASIVGIFVSAKKSSNTTTPKTIRPEKSLLKNLLAVRRVASVSGAGEAADLFFLRRS